MTRVAVLQSNYIPWKGYFDVIDSVDLFRFYDDLQYTKNDWRNRNKIETSKGPSWLTIPVGTDLHRLICEVELKDPTWQEKHWTAFLHWYSATPHFAQYKKFFKEIYLGHHWNNLSVLNQFLIQSIARDCLGIRTAFADSGGVRPRWHEAGPTNRPIEKSGGVVVSHRPRCEGLHRAGTIREHQASN